MYDIEISSHKTKVKIKPLNDDAMNWLRITILKPYNIQVERYESIHIAPTQLEKTLRKMMSSGYQVNFIKTGS